jgi:hypothetical protein
MTLVAPSPLTLTPSTHRFFDDLITALGSQAALGAGYITHAQETAYIFGNLQTMRMVCLTRQEGNSHLEVEVKPENILTPITQFTWPKSLDLIFEVVINMGSFTLPVPRGIKSVNDLNGYQKMQANIIEHAFIAYYEKSLKKINEVRSKKDHATLAFANAVRNAFSHGGSIHFDVPKASTKNITVSWQNLSYSHSDNGRHLMYNDLSQGDIILLMIEMDKLF